MTLKNCQISTLLIFYPPLQFYLSLCRMSPTPTRSETRPHPTSPGTHVHIITLILTDSTGQNIQTKTLVQPDISARTFYCMSYRKIIITRMDENQMSMKYEPSEIIV